MKMSERVRQEARLFILVQLNEQRPSNALTSTTLRDHLADVKWIDREKAWVEAELAWLEEYGAVEVVDADGEKIAVLKEPGKRHLRRAAMIPGIKVPDEAIATI